MKKKDDVIFGYTLTVMENVSLIVFFIFTIFLLNKNHQTTQILVTIGFFIYLTLKFYTYKKMIKILEKNIDYE